MPLTVMSGLSSVFTNAVISLVQDRTVSVLPSRNNRVIDASYVRQNFPWSYDIKTKKISDVQKNKVAEYL